MLRLILSPFLLLFIGLTLSSNLFAQAPKNPHSATTKESPPKTPPAAAMGSKTSTDIFEKEEDEEGQTEEDSKLKSLTAKVKVIRDDGDGREVFFTSDKVTGAFYLRRSLEGYGKHLKTLEASRKPQGPAVTIKYDENQIIKSIDSGKNSSADKEPDPNQKWDFGDVPE